MTPSRLISIAFDAVAILLFAFLARIAHRSASMPLTFASWLDTAWPFLVGTLVASGVVAATKLVPWRIWPAGVIIWLTTAVAGLTIWSLRHGHLAHWSFMIVATVMSGMLLISWRAAIRLLRKASPASRQ